MQRAEPLNLNTSYNEHIDCGRFLALWCAFRRATIVASTLAEVWNFGPEAEEASGTWSDWQKPFTRNKEESQCVERCRQGMVLVNAVGHRYIREEAWIR